MKKIDIGQMVSIFANLGVLAGIVFLAVEVHQTQIAMQSQAYQARALDAIYWDYELAKDKQIRKIAYQLETGEIDLSTLSSEERQVALYLVDAAKVDVDNEHYQYENGFLDPGFYNGVTVPSIRKRAPIWRDLGLTEGRPAFRREVDRILRDASLSSSDN